MKFETVFFLLKRFTQALFFSRSRPPLARQLPRRSRGVAQTRRLHFAKKLIDETRLPMTQVAIASGFGCVRFEGIVDGSDFSKRLREIPGIGKWTAQYVAMSVPRDPDAFPSGDIELQRAIGERSAGDLEKRSEAWRPWRSYAAMLLWHTIGNGNR
jgi:hypothetical protein